MKKLISIITAAALVLALLPAAFAADSAEMEAALTEVKGKIDVPSEYSEFSAEYYDYNDGDVSYYFTWSNTAATESLSVETDAKGRIMSYALDNIDSSYSYGDVYLAEYSASEVREFAKAQLERLMPEAFGADDTLVVSSSSYSSNRNRYSVMFKREKNGEVVSSEYVNVVLGVDGDGALYVKYANISYHYDAEFEAQTDEIADLGAAYQAASPAELQYYINYSYENGKTVKTAGLHYVNQREYMSVYSGESVDVYYDGMYEDATSDSTASGSSSNRMLTDAEIAKLEEISGLKSADEILNAAQGIEILGLSDDVTADYSGINETDGERYIMSVSLSIGGYITADAKTGEILSIYIYNNYSDSAENAATADGAREKIDAFLNEYSSKSGEYREESANENDGTLTIRYTRYINDIPCPNDSIYIRYSLKTDKLISYSIGYTDISFPSPGNIISADEAYNVMLENGGLERKYICTAKNEYKLCVILTNYSAVDAFTGKLENESIESEYSHDSYTDIEGHWCQEAVETLEQSGIAFNGNLLKPDEPITQSDLLRLAVIALEGMSAGSMSYDEETLYRYAEELMPFTEDGEETYVTRENACVYFARALELEPYAKSADMYNAPFTDADKISADKIGYVTLLAAAGAVGKNGAFRPSDCMTYAEACTVLYNILNLGL